MTTEELTEVLKAIGSLRPQQTMNFNAPIGQQIAHVDKIEAHFDKDMKMHVTGTDEVVGMPSAEIMSGDDGITNHNTINNSEELFHFIYPGTDDKEAMKIHKQVKDLVKRFAIKDICTFLKQLAEEKKILLPQIPQNAFDELHRMGMPPADTNGFGYDNFCKYYRK